MAEVREAKRLRRGSPQGHRRSLRGVSGVGFGNTNGRPFSPSSIKAMIGANV
jgi:hypothetical protein